MIKMIVACGRNGEIGKDNSLLEHIPEDMIYFKSQTENSIVVMGRKTYNSLPFKGGLPKRENYIVTRTPERSKYTDCRFLNLKDTQGFVSTYTKIFQEKDVWIMGGSSIYKAFEDLVEEVHVTKIDNDFPDADTFVNLSFLSEFKLQNTTPLNDYCKVELWRKNGIT